MYIYTPRWPTATFAGCPNFSSPFTLPMKVSLFAIAPFHCFTTVLYVGSFAISCRVACYLFPQALHNKVNRCLAAYDSNLNPIWSALNWCGESGVLECESGCSWVKKGWRCLHACAPQAKTVRMNQLKNQTPLFMSKLPVDDPWHFTSRGVVEGRYK